MNRKDLIGKLVAEGFSEKTLSKFNDNQLEKFSKKILKEAQTVTTTKTVYNSKDPKDVAALNTALKTPNIDPKTIEVKEDDIIPVSKIRSKLKKKSKKTLNLKKLNEFVDNLVDNTYHSFTRKSEMVELIKEKMNTLSDKSEVPAIPEFMEGVMEDQPSTAPAPTKPDVEPATDPGAPERQTPPHPGKRPTDPNQNPIPDPAPKASAKEISGNEAKSKIIQMVHRIFTGH